MIPLQLVPADKINDYVATTAPSTSMLQSEVLQENQRLKAERAVLMKRY